MFMMSSRTWLKGSAIGLENPGEVLNEVNNLLHEENEQTMFVTLFYAIYNPRNGELTYANGGHNPPLLVKQDGSSELLPPVTGIALGVAPDMGFGQNAITLAPGESVIFYTDGVTEAMNAAQEEFGLERLQAVFSDGAPLDSREANRAIFEAVHAFAGDQPQSDDITCLVLRRH